MSTKYNHGDHIPTEVLAERLRELVRVIIERPEGWQSEFSMRVPAELDRDADVVLGEAAARLELYARELGDVAIRMGYKEKP